MLVDNGSLTTPCYGSPSLAILCPKACSTKGGILLLLFALSTGASTIQASIATASTPHLNWNWPWKFGGSQWEGCIRLPFHEFPSIPASRPSTCPLQIPSKPALPEKKLQLLPHYHESMNPLFKCLFSRASFDWPSYHFIANPSTLHNCCLAMLCTLIQLALETPLCGWIPWCGRSRWRVPWNCLNFLLYCGRRGSYSFSMDIGANIRIR